MDPVASFALSIGGVVAGVMTVRSVRTYLDCRPARRALADAPPLVLTSAEGQIACATGIVRTAESTMTAPLSARQCVVARARIRIRQQGFLGIGARPYETFAMVPFIVDVPRVGHVRVEGRYALLDLPARAMSKRNSTPGSRERMLADHILSDTARSTPSFDESIVEPGMLVSVAGVLMKEAPRAPEAGEQGYRDSGPPSFVLQGTVDRPLAIGRCAEARDAKPA
jgi:hypothetical protein